MSISVGHDGQHIEKDDVLALALFSQNSALECSPSCRIIIHGSDVVVIVGRRLLVWLRFASADTSGVCAKPTKYVGTVTWMTH